MNVSREDAAILRQMRSVLADEHAWTKGAPGLTVKGVDVSGYDPTAVQRCLIGAREWTIGAQAWVGQCYRDFWNKDSIIYILVKGVQVLYPHTVCEEILQRHDIEWLLAERQCLARIVTDFNDHRTTTHTDVLALLDWAIAQGEESIFDVLAEFTQPALPGNVTEWVEV